MPCRLAPPARVVAPLVALGCRGRRFLRVLVTRSFQYRSLYGERQRSVVGLRRYQPPYDSVLLHFHVHFYPLAWPGNQSHQCCPRPNPCTDPRPLLLGLVRSGVYPQERDGCAHVHDGTWRLSPQAGLPILPVGLVPMRSTGMAVACRHLGVPAFTCVYS